MATLIRIPLASIHVGDRARPIDEGQAQAIAASMAERGLINPITVRKTPALNKGKTPYALVAGGHRHRGAEINGWTEIDAIAVDADQTEAQLIELSENLYRNELSKLDRAIFVLKFREMWQDKHGQIERGRDPKKKGNDYPIIFASGRQLADRVSQRLGFSSETFKLVNRIGQNLHPDLRQMVRGTPAEDDQTKLLKLAKKPIEEQMRIAAALRIDPNLDKALSYGKEPKVTLAPQDAVFAKLASSWEKADAETRRRFLDHVGDQEDLSYLEAAQ